MFGRVLIEEMIVVDDRFSLEKNGFLEIWTWSKVDLDFKNSFQKTELL